MGKMSRQKGATFERYYARVLQLAGVRAKRGIGQTRAAGDVADVDVAGWWHELKHGIAPSWRAALAQSKAALRDRAKKETAEAPRAPLVVTRDNGDPVVVHLELEHFLPLFLAWESMSDEGQTHFKLEAARALLAAAPKRKAKKPKASRTGGGGRRPSSKTLKETPPSAHAVGAGVVPSQAPPGAVG